MTTSTQTSSTITPADQFIIGALLVIGISIFAFLDSLLNTSEFAAIVTGYGVVAVAYGVYLMENSTAIHTFWKYLVIIVVTATGYGLTLLANNWLQITTVSTMAKPVLIAALVITLANFVLNDVQTYVTSLPDNVITDATWIIGAVIVVAQAVENAPAGSIINISTLLAVAVPVLMVYIFQKIPWPTPPSSSVPAGAAVKTA